MGALADEVLSAGGMSLESFHALSGREKSRTWD
jgi:hypothetical protein